MDRESIYKGLLSFLQEEQILQDESMRKHTTFKIGGNADFMINALNKDDVVATFKFARNNEIPVFMIGKASNLLVRDNGIRGIVVKNSYDNIEIIKETEDEMELEVASGTPLVKLAKFALENSLEGLEFCYGIPGTMGGAVRMNAGAYGGEIESCVVESLVLDKDGIEKILSFEEHEFGYRKSSIAKNEYILLSTKIRLKKGNKIDIKTKMDANMSARLEKQPYDMPSAGSVFKRGNGFITAQIIDEAGLKGTRFGDAVVSEKHAGFIVNSGKATAKDVIDLIEYIKKVVKEKYDKELETEVIVVGEM